MKVTITKRYCYSQFHNWSGGFGKALSEVEELREKHPDSRIVVEYNERSSTTNFRVVRYTEIEVEVPDMPSKDEFEIPKKPRAKRIPWDKIEKTTEAAASKDSWGYNKWLVTLTHTPTGVYVKRNMWSTSDKYGIGNAKAELESKVDTGYEAKRAHYRLCKVAYNEAMKEWQKEADKVIREAVIKK